jgi:protein involved in polysaccharide export with SLBB domain
LEELIGGPRPDVIEHVDVADEPDAGDVEPEDKPLVIEVGGHDVPEPAMKPLVAPKVAGEVTIQPESIIEVLVKEDSSLNGKYKINQFSAIEFGYMGLVFLENMTADMAAFKIEELLKNRGFRKATIKVRIVKASYDTIRVTGVVAKPGDQRIGPGSRRSLTKVLLTAGGLIVPAKDAGVRIVRNGILNPLPTEKGGEVHMLTDTNGNARVPNVFLDNNDLVIVFPSKELATTAPGQKQITVTGEVSKRGVFVFHENEECTILRLFLVKMGGNIPKWAGDATIIRKDKKGKDREIKVRLRKLLDTADPKLDVPLQHGDRIIVKSRGIILFD